MFKYLKGEVATFIRAALSNIDGFRTYATFRANHPERPHFTPDWEMFLPVFSDTAAYFPRFSSRNKDMV